MKVGIVGLGYVGLPLAVAFAQAGRDVVGFDTSVERVAALGEGHSPVEDIPDEQLASISERFAATADPAELAGCEAILVCVPTPLTGHREPDLSFIEDSARAIAAVLREGQLVVLESTTFPGTTRDHVAPLLEVSGLSAGVDFNLAYSPERVDPGRTDHTMRTVPKVVGGLTPACLERAAALYGEICDTVVEVSSPEAAEMTKLLENIYRSVNIALVNELARLTDRMGMDIWEVIGAAATKPYGFTPYEPGPGMGGHCLPVDPFYLTYKAREFDFSAEFIELAGKINASQPYYCVEKIQRALNGTGKALSGSKIVLAGVSYKAGVGDTRESPALKLIELFRAAGAEVVYHDPHVPELAGLGLRSTGLEEALAGADAAVIVTAHPEVDHELIIERAPLVVDLRGVTRGRDLDNVVLL